MHFRARAAIAITAIAVVAMVGAWAAGLFSGDPAPEGAIAGDSVTVEVGDSSFLPDPIAAVLPDTGLGQAVVAGVMVLLALVGVVLLRNARHRRSVEARSVRAEEG